jgi:hypothetical protein
MNVAEKMLRIELAANAWHAAIEMKKYDVALHWMRQIGGIYRSLTTMQRRQFDEAFHQHWDEFDESDDDDDETERERAR